MQTHNIKRIHENKKRMIVARGGKRGKTAGRGGKGQTARAGNKRRPEWRDIIKKLPKLRGRGVNPNKPFQEVNTPVNVGLIEEVFNSGDMITPTILLEKGVISLKSGKVPIVKILGDGEVSKSFKISGCLISKKAKELIEKAGGSVELLSSQVAVEEKPKTETKKTEKPEVKKEKKPEAKKEKKTKAPTEKKASKK